MKKSANIFLGILGAATAGVVIGMLIAPEKGKDLRKNLRSSGGDIAKKLGDLISQGKDLLSKGQDHYEEARNNAMDEVNDFKHEANSAYRKAKSSI